MRFVGTPVPATQSARVCQDLVTAMDCSQEDLTKSAGQWREELLHIGEKNCCISTVVPQTHCVRLTNAKRLRCAARGNQASDAGYPEESARGAVIAFSWIQMVLFLAVGVIVIFDR